MIGVFKLICFVMARFGPGNLIEGAPFSEVIPRARPPGRGEHFSGVS